MWQGGQTAAGGRRLEGKVAVVTGASRGLGKAIALVLGSQGARLVLNARQQRALLDEVVALVQELGGEAMTVVGDVSQPDVAASLSQAAMERYGQLDVVVNNAGIEEEQGVPVGEVSLESWERVLRVNLTGTFLVCKHAIPALLATGGGSIINISSVAGLAGWAGDAAYNASKAGVILLTKTLALDYARHGIRANCVCPGVIETEMTTAWLAQAGDSAEAEAGALRALHPVGRFGQPDDVAHAVLYLASDEARFVTGTTLVVDGGFLAR